MDEGIQIERSDEHVSNADPPRIEILEPGSKARFERFLQSLKQREEIFLMDEGMRIDSSREHRSNAEMPNFEMWQPGSNVTFQRFWQPPKQLLETV
jgi:hypothetical protein